MFVAPTLSDDQAIALIVTIFFGLDQDMDAFIFVMNYLLQNHLFRLHSPANPPLLNANGFSLMIDDATSIVRYRFTIPQIVQLSEFLVLPVQIVTPIGDKIDRVQALAMLCRHLAEPLRLSTMMNEFGRSVASLSRIISHTIYLLYVKHVNLIFFNRRIIKTRLTDYAAVIHEKDRL